MTTHRRPHRLLLVLLFITGAAACAPGRPPGGERAPAPARLHLFLLAGQSNMAGRGVVESRDRVAHPRVLMLDRQGRWRPATDPMHFDKPIAGVGPGRSFGLALAEADPGVTVGLVPAAVGGSPITTWEPGVLDPATGSHPYDDAIARARAAMRDGELKAILWHQGESDATAQAAPEYYRRLRALVERFRRDLGDPELPVLVGQLGRFQERPWSPAHEQVDAAHRRLAAELPNVVFVSAEGLEHKGDTVHFSAAAARELGRRYAEAYRDVGRAGARR